MKYFYYYKEKEILWFRIFGVGLSFNKKMKFSQRIGRSKYLKVFGWIIAIIK